MTTSKWETNFRSELLRLHPDATYRNATRAARVYCRGLGLTGTRWARSVAIAFEALGRRDQRKRWRM